MVINPHTCPPLPIIRVYFVIRVHSLVINPQPVPAISNKRAPAAQAVFLDRDGVINRAVVRDGKPYPPARAEEFEILPGVPEGCAALKAAGFLLVVATNQPDVGRGTQKREVVEAIHGRMRSLLPIDRVEVCYDSGDGDPSSLRKPAPGMLLAAAEALGIDLAQSWMIGDRWRDVECGRAAGCRTIFIDCGYHEKLVAPPTHTVSNFAAAVRIILGECPSRSQRHHRGAQPGGAGNPKCEVEDQNDATFLCRLRTMWTIAVQRAQGRFSNL